MSSGSSDRFGLDGKVALVTGATGILGRHFCRALAHAGAHVAAVDLDQAVCDQFAEELSKESGVRAIGIAGDVSSPASVASFVGQVVREFGAIHVLHNNAATKTRDMRAFFLPPEEYSLDLWREIMAVNIDGMFLVAQAVGKQMIAQGGGSIVQTASIYGVVAPDQRIYEGSDYLGGPINCPVSYTVSKSAVIGLTKYLATYWAEKNVRVNTLTPGGMESGQNERFITNYSRRVPLGRMGKPDELVGALIYLASDASSYVTGQNIIVDGGLSVW